MSHRCVIPNEGEERNRYSHVNSHENLTHHMPMSNHEVAELTWKNGQLSKHELGGIFPAAPTKLTWSRTGDTLESIVHQATCTKQNPNLMQHGQNIENVGSVASSSGGKWPEYLDQDHFTPGSVKKRTRSSMADDEGTVRSACASTDARFCRDNDSTLITWASIDSTRSTKTKTADDDSACHGGSENQEEERVTKSESGRSHSTRRGRAATIHNQSERRRRDRINQKMKDLQKLVPHASKTDKASMLDEVIEYLKLLQAQVHLMSAGNMPHIMMPLAMQHHLHMSLLARMGMGLGLGMGMGMLDMSSFARLAPQQLAPLIHPIQASTTASPFVPPPFVVPHMVQQASCDPGNSSAAPMPDPYSAYLAQVKNMNLFFS
ncbi:hypothetical protein Nepgr_018951 [Nepenthes gracilis]|uniref:BHLH domain-containing protein n=1 Tax=Nepenthes gracilis TaxID=150966 RepID=A0AAD3SUB7_NEPGR|nr:hypothetical protein Nepgr_018951 [Nepenthes gracilis]